MKILAATAWILSIFLVCSQVHAADRVRVGYSSITANRLPLWLGKEAGKTIDESRFIDRINT